MIVPFGKISRNGVMYDRESIERTASQIVGKPIMYNHETEGDVLPRGEWKSYEIKEDGLYGQGVIYNTDYNKDLIEYLNAAENAHVSLQVLGDAERKKEATTGEDYSLATIKNWLEISIVPVEGFEQAKVNSFEYFIAESFKAKKEIIVNTSNKEDINTTTADGVLSTAILNKKDNNENEGIDLTDEKQPKNKDETSMKEQEDTPDEQKEIEDNNVITEEFDSTMEDVTSILEDLKARISALEQKESTKEAEEVPEEDKLKEEVEDPKDKDLKESDEDEEKSKDLKESDEDDKPKDELKESDEDEDEDKDLKESDEDEDKDLKESDEDIVDEDKKEEDDKPKPPLLENIKQKFSPIDLSLKESVNNTKQEFAKITKELFFKK
jgi:hypothetical protein